MISIPEPHRIGAIEVTRIPELTLSTLATDDLIPEWRPGRADSANEWMVPNHLDPTQRHVVITTGSWLVRRPGLVAIVDTAVGNDKKRAMAAFDHLQTPFLEHLAAAGVQPEDVDLILLTHLHSDHVGWNTSLVEGEWRPTFPNARYVMPRADLDRVEALVALEGAGSPKAALFFDSVKPVLDAGLAEFVGPGDAHGPAGFTWHPTPGHCSGHMSISFVDGGRTGFFAGDVMHHPIQVARPEWSSVFSGDPTTGERSRRSALDFAADQEAMVFSSHFAASGAGRVRKQDGTYRWMQVE